MWNITCFSIFFRVEQRLNERTIACTCRKVDVVRPISHIYIWLLSKLQTIRITIPAEYFTDYGDFPQFYRFLSSYSVEMKTNIHTHTLRHKWDSDKSKEWKRFYSVRTLFAPSPVLSIWIGAFASVNGAQETKIIWFNIQFLLNV